MSQDCPSDGTVFRANKRRKVSRHHDYDKDRTQAVPQRTLESSEDDDDRSSSVQRVARSFTNRKQGVTFHNKPVSNATNGGRDSSETALVLATPVEQDLLASNDRFTKPTGKAGVTEDKHLAAYLEAKLAEIRDPRRTRTVIVNPSTYDDSARQKKGDKAARSEEAESLQSRNKPINPDHNVKSSSVQTGTRTAEDDVEEVSLDSLPSHRRPPKSHPPNSSTTPRKWRVPPKSAEDQLRDSLIDQIMSESQPSLYDTHHLHKPHLNSSSQPHQKIQGKDMIDNDAAFAASFEAEFLAEIEDRNLRKRPAPGAAAAMNDALSGPKLGGSRMQRERMRAAVQAGSVPSLSSNSNSHLQSQTTSRKI